jgi:hypothetical protein
MLIDVRGNTNILSPYRPRRMAAGEVDYMEAISDDFLKTVIFLCVDDIVDGVTKRVPKATGLCVRVLCEDSQDIYVDYVVTAKHNINKARKYGKIYIRLNLKNGGYTYLKTDVNDWLLHDKADVAAIPTSGRSLPSGVKGTDTNQSPITLDWFVGGAPEYNYVGNTRFGKMEISPRVGHRVFFVGLFTQSYPDEPSLPIARFGYVSRMPGIVSVRYGDITERIIAYLMEFQSRGGHSGSPVFFHIPITLQDGKHTRLGWIARFIGIVNAHYDIVREAEEEEANHWEWLDKMQIKLNSGIAVVTPAEDVRVLLMSEDFVEYRKEVKKRIDAKRPTAILDNAVADEVFTGEDFLRDLRKVSQRKSGKEQS